MASEASKLFTVSIGKIQQTKQAKCGPNLRKSVLVASVLHRARNVYVAEMKSRRAESVEDQQPKKRPRFLSQRSVIEQKDTHEETEDSNSNSILTQADTPTVVESLELETEQCNEDSSISLTDQVLDQIAVDTDVEVTSTSSSSTGQSESQNENIGSDTDLSNNNCLKDKENNPPDTSVLLSTRANSLTCKPCLKRRNTYTQDFTNTKLSNAYSNSGKLSPHNPNDTESESVTLPRKRHRSGATERNSDLSTTTCTSSTYTNQMETSQINNLVQIFNDSFSNFSTDPSSVCADQSTELNTFSLCRDAIALTA